MCGIAGIVSPDRSQVTPERLYKMTKALAHRGPDGEQVWINPGANLGFGHRRLSILDLSSAAAQPMHYMDRYTLVFNGAIYNYIELKALLRTHGYLFRSNSDTEVILAAYDCFGEHCCQHFDGMFAFAIWDEHQQILFAARDRFGEKPFYYCVDNNAFLFGSEMKALWAAGCQKSMDPSMLLNYLALGHVRDTRRNGDTIFIKINEIPPASTLTYDVNTQNLALQPYWSLEKNQFLDLPENEAIDTFQKLWQQSVTRRLRADVSLGTSMSGGLDSSAIIVSAADLRQKGLKTYSAVFPGFRNDESEYVELVSKQFDLLNYRTSPGPEELADDLERLLWHQEEFISSSSVYAQFKVFELAEKHGTVVLLDGQGADEILAGYLKYIHWGLQELYKKPGKEFMNNLKGFKNNDIKFEWGWKNKLASYLPSLTAKKLENRELNKLQSNDLLNKEFINEYGKDLVHKPVIQTLNDILYYNTIHDGLGELLRYADRNAMAHGRELRLPFLSHELVSFVFSLPTQFKLRDGWTKWILRKTMENKLPEKIVWRKTKVGFEPPQKTWMGDDKIQQMIQEAKRKLVRAKILNDATLSKKIQPLDSPAADNYDWRFLVAGSL
jgi:asparagine synthase (glutamine-hydrolysing)